MTPANPCIALVQKPPVYLNLEATLNKAVEEIEAAADRADLIVFPECWLPGYPVWIDEAPEAASWNHAGAKTLYRLLSENAVTLGDRHLARLADAAARTGAFIVLGAHERRGGTLYNTSFIFAPDGGALWHRKLVPTYTERLIWGRGDGSTLETMETPFGVLGALICWEHWMPLLRAAMHARTEAIHVAQWPTVNEMHLVASRHYAFEGRCFLAASGCLLSKRDVMAGFRSLDVDAPEAEALLESIAEDDDALLQRGGSTVIAPNGDLLCEPVFDAETVLTATLDLSRLAEERMALDTAGHYARPDIFELHIDRREKTGVVVGRN